MRHVGRSHAHRIPRHGIGTSEELGRNALRLSPEGMRARGPAVVAALVAAIALLALPAPVRSALVDGCPLNSYLGNRPSNSENPDWSDNAQGIANDGEHWFFTDISGLFKYDAAWHERDGSDTGKIKVVSFPPALSAMGIDHFGDLDYYRGYLFVPFEDNKPECPLPCQDVEPICPWCSHDPPFAIIGVFRAEDLEFVDWVDVTDTQGKAGWVAIHPLDGSLFTSRNAIDAEHSYVLRYALDMQKVDNGVWGDFFPRDENGMLLPPEEIAVRDPAGDPSEDYVFSTKFKYMQGGVFSPWGDLYLVAGRAGESAADTHGGIHLFRRETNPTEPVTKDDRFWLRESTINVDDHVRQGVFAFEYDPAVSAFPDDWLPLGQEPEGIDWWSWDNDPDAAYPGQLHVILLDNQVDDDQIWLKHYQVDYVCALNDDTDGDGITDGDEVYRDHTSPLHSDTDGDGIDDAVDDCPSIANPDQADLDEDGIGDSCDADIDGDGQTNHDETACGSSPLDPGSIAPDLDGDHLPDCVDPDDDGDGVADESDRCPGTLVPDPVIPSSGMLKTNRYALLDDDLVFDRKTIGSGDEPQYTTMTTGGCNAEQIADALGLGRSHYEFGITRSVLEAWIAIQP